MSERYTRHIEDATLQSRRVVRAIERSNELLMRSRKSLNASGGGLVDADMKRGERIAACRAASARTARRAVKAA
jgi:hypothetical protein